MTHTGQKGTPVPAPEKMFAPDVATAAAELFRAELLRAVETRGSFNVALSGGRTPLSLWAQLASMTDLPWQNVRVFWGDERFVPHDHEDSNYRNARAGFLDRLPVNEANIHPWPAPRPGLTLQQAAAEYAVMLSETLGATPGIDLMLLGLGADAHTASLYPNDPAIFQPGLTAYAHPPGIEHPRLTLTPRALSSSRTVAFLVSGERKRAALESTFSSVNPDPAYPARYVGARRRRVIITDLT